MKVNEFITNLTMITKLKIAELAKSELNNLDKKAVLDEKVTLWATKTLENIPVNFLVKFLIKKYFIANVSVITQNIYDLLKAKIQGVTKEV
jgi:hypothetical protein